MKEARIHLGRVYLRTNETNWVRYQTPASMREEIIAFDRGGSFEPQEFRLAAVVPSKTKRTHQGGKDAPRSKRTKKRRAPHIVANVRGGPA